MIPLFKPYMPDVPDIEKILHSGALSYGEYTKQFEDKLRKYFGTPLLMVTNTFYSAISVLLATLGFSRDDNVISSPMACLVSTQPYLSNGLKVCWADVDPNTGTLDPDSVRERIKKNTKAIIHNHFCGYPGYIDEINAIGKEFGIPVVDDGIECFGSEYKDKKIGNCGSDVTVFSLSAVRFCNCNEGGILIFKDKELFEKALIIRDSGIDRSRFRDNLGEINPDCDISLIGYNAMMSNVNSYIGLKQMEHVSDLLESHRSQAKKWDSFFENKKGFQVLNTKHSKPNYWVYGILSDNKIETIKSFRQQGYYASGVHVRNDIYSVFGKQDVELKGTSEFYKSFVALPCGWWMKELS